MECINLKERFGDRFKVDYEGSYYAERWRKTTEEAWRMILLCENGHICPWGGSELAACTNGTRVASKLKRLPFTTIAQDGDDGANIVFDVKHFEEVAEILRPRKRRRQSPEAAERLRQYRFKPARQHSPGDQTGLPAA